MRALQASESTVFAGLGESHACYLLAASNALTKGERLRPNARRSTKAHANIRPPDAASELSVSATRGRVPRRAVRVAPIGDTEMLTRALGPRPAW